eukprot:Clim_evm8s157 gene=Clim_evmTU8s157
MRSNKDVSSQSSHQPQGDQLVQDDTSVPNAPVQPSIGRQQPAQSAQPETSQVALSQQLQPQNFGRPQLIQQLQPGTSQQWVWQATGHRQTLPAGPYSGAHYQQHGQGYQIMQTIQHLPTPMQIAYMVPPSIPHQPQLQTPHHQQAQPLQQQPSQGQQQYRPHHQQHHPHHQQHHPHHQQHHPHHPHHHPHHQQPPQPQQPMPIQHSTVSYPIVMLPINFGNQEQPHFVMGQQQTQPGGVPGNMNPPQTGPQNLQMAIPGQPQQFLMTSQGPTVVQLAQPVGLKRTSDTQDPNSASSSQSKHARVSITESQEPVTAEQGMTRNFQAAYDSITRVENWRNRVDAAVARLCMRKDPRNPVSLFKWGRMTMSVRDSDKSKSIELWKPKRRDLIAVIAYIYGNRNKLFGFMPDHEFVLEDASTEDGSYRVHDLSDNNFIELQQELEKHWAVNKSTLAPVVRSKKFLLENTRPRRLAERGSPSKKESDSDARSGSTHSEESALPSDSRKSGQDEVTEQSGNIPPGDLPRESTRSTSGSGGKVTRTNISRQVTTAEETNNNNTSSGEKGSGQATSQPRQVTTTSIDNSDSDDERYSEGSGHRSEGHRARPASHDK